jgi:hypothetical protein
MFEEIQELLQTEDSLNQDRACAIQIRLLKWDGSKKDMKPHDISAWVPVFMFMVITSSIELWGSPNSIWKQCLGKLRLGAIRASFVVVPMWRETSTSSFGVHSGVYGGIERYIFYQKFKGVSHICVH